MYWMSAMAVSASSCRWGKTTCNRRRTCGTVNAAAFSPQLAALPNQKVVRQEGHGQVVVPPAPATHFILIHPDFARAFQDRRLHWPAHATLAHQRGVRCRGWGIGQV